jgi:hypothetical protein
MKRIALAVALSLFLPAVALANNLRIVHDTTFAVVSLPVGSAWTEVRRVRFTLTTSATVIVTTNANVGGTTCIGGVCGTSSGSMFAFAYTGVKVAGGTGYYGGTSGAPAMLSIAGGAGTTSVSASIPVTVSHPTSFSLPPGTYDAVLSGVNTGNPSAVMRHYGTTILIIED